MNIEDLLNNSKELDINVILNTEVSVFSLLWVRYSEKEIDTLVEGVYIPPKVQLFRKIEKGDISSLIQALNNLGEELGFDTQILYLTLQI